MKKLAFILAVVCAVLLLFLAVTAPAGGHPAAPSVVFVGLTNNPKRQMTPARICVPTGTTGLCALFWVANIPANDSVWFKTASVEQKTASGWEPYYPNANWSGIEGGAWTPGYGCLFAVGWPPGLATNASWRLQVGYGRDTPTLATFINQKLGREIFAKSERFVPSSEVVQSP